MQSEMLSKISIIVPSLNPDEKLKNTVKSLLDVGFTDIICVNDGSNEEATCFFPEPSDKITVLKDETMIKLLTDGSRQSYQLIDQLDEAGLSYEIETTMRNDAPLLIIDNKELNFTKAQRWIKKQKVKDNDSII